MELALREAKARLSELVAAASNGERAVITRHGRPVVELVPCNQRPGGIDFQKLEETRRDLGIVGDGEAGRNSSKIRHSAGRFSPWTNDMQA